MPAAVDASPTLGPKLKPPELEGNVNAGFEAEVDSAAFGLSACGGVTCTEGTSGVFDTAGAGNENGLGVVSLFFGPRPVPRLANGFVAV